MEERERGRGRQQKGGKEGEKGEKEGDSGKEGKKETVPVLTGEPGWWSGAETALAAWNGTETQTDSTVPQCPVWRMEWNGDTLLLVYGVGCMDKMEILP